jgi:hypothetical protein
MTDAELYVAMLETEVQALRSVLSEYGADHAHFVQWQRAQSANEMRNSLVPPGRSASLQNNIINRVAFNDFRELVDYFAKSSVEIISLETLNYGNGTSYFAWYYGERK